jgi:uncharacterized protein (UPF0548 family)
MFLIQEPVQMAIETFIEANRSSAFSYNEVGQSRQSDPPIGYTIDHNRIDLGRGDDVFESAKRAIRAWKMFDMPWVELCYPQTPIRENEVVAVLVHHFGFYSLNAARIVYVIDEPDRFGFAYGTLADHGERGEERFSVQFDRGTGDVTYDLYAFSRPNLFLAQIGYPLSRMLQKRFAAESKLAMLRAVSSRADTLEFS